MRWQASRINIGIECIFYISFTDSKYKQQKIRKMRWISFDAASNPHG